MRPAADRPDVRDLLDDVGIPIAAVWIVLALPTILAAAWWMGFVGSTPAEAQPAVAPPTTRGAPEATIDSTLSTAAPGRAATSFGGADSAVTTTIRVASWVLVDGATSVAGRDPGVVLIDAAPDGGDVLTLTTPGAGSMVLTALDGMDVELIADAASVTTSLDEIGPLSSIEVLIDGPWALSWSSSTD